MQAVKLPGSAGFDWLKKGFAIFKKRPTLFIALAFVWNFNTILSVQLLGVFGIFSVALVQPIYIAFILLCCHFISENKSLIGMNYLSHLEIAKYSNLYCSRV